MPTLNLTAHLKYFVSKLVEHTKNSLKNVQHELCHQLLLLLKHLIFAPCKRSLHKMHATIGNFLQGPIVNMSAFTNIVLEHYIELAAAAEVIACGGEIACVLIDHINASRLHACWKFSKLDTQNPDDKMKILACVDPVVVSTNFQYELLYDNYVLYCWQEITHNTKFSTLSDQFTVPNSSMNIFNNRLAHVQNWWQRNSTYKNVLSVGGTFFLSRDKGSLKMIKLL